MGLLKDAYWLRMYLNAKAKSDLIDAIEGEHEATSKGRKKRSSKVVSSNNTESHHLGFWDFLDKQIHSEEEKPQSWKEMLKAVALLILLLIIIVGILLLIDLYQRHVGSTDPIFG